ncbi:MAG: DUF2169 domain-containing protein [Polyangiaceae bacterium]
MRVCNNTGMWVMTKGGSRRPPQPEMTVIVRGSYAVEEDMGLRFLDDPAEAGPPTGDVFSGDEREGECLFASDFADFKLNGELVLRADCHPPGGEASECPVRLRLPGRDKLLHVVGDRVWEVGALGRRASKPAPFSSMPLTWSRAFGGEGVDDNPAGAGSEAPPNVFFPGEVMNAPGDKPRPASFGPIHPDWKARRRHLGRAYGKSWREKRFPYFAEDFSYRYFHAAPEDQAIEGYFRGDEALGFDNLHPRHPKLDVTLPGKRLRAFARLDDGRVSEITMVLDTVFAELTANKIHLVWRGVTDVREDDLDDVRTLLVVQEPLAEAPREASHYEAMLAAFEADPTGVAEMLEAVPPLGEDHPTESDDALGSFLERKLGPFKKEEQDELVAALAEARNELPEDQAAELDATLKERLAAADVDVAPTARRLRQDAPADLRIRKLVRRALEPLPELRERLQDEQIPEAKRVEVRERIAILEGLAERDEWTKLDPDYTPPLEPLSEDAPGPQANLRERDLAGRDLAGLDLSGADLREADLSHADLRGAKLVGAKLDKAILYKARLDEAVLEGASLRLANAAKATLPGAKLAGAALDDAFFEDADLSRAELTRVTATFAIFTRAKLAGASFEEADLTGADLEQADLRRASLDGAVLDRCFFIGATAEEASFTGSSAAGASFMDARLAGAKLRGLRGPKSVWQRAALDAADLTGAILSGAELSGARAEAACLAGVTLREARLRRVVLDGADLSGSDCFRATLDKASLHGTNLERANLYGASLLGAHGKDTRLVGAILDGSTLDPATSP